MLYSSYESYPSHAEFSYLYSEGNTNYHYPHLLDDYSFLPTLEFNQKKIIFTFNQRYALYHEQEFIYSIKELIQKIKLPQSLDQNILDQIAMIANYLAQGKTYECLPKTTKLEGKELSFTVKPSFCCKKKSDIHYLVRLPAFGETDEIRYQLMT